MTPPLYSREHDQLSAIGGLSPRADDEGNYARAKAIARVLIYRTKRPGNPAHWRTHLPRPMSSVLPPSRPSSRRRPGPTHQRDGFTRKYSYRDKNGSRPSPG